MATCVRNELDAARGGYAAAVSATRAGAVANCRLRRGTEALVVRHADDYGDLDGVVSDDRGLSGRGNLAHHRSQCPAQVTQVVRAHEFRGARIRASAIYSSPGWIDPCVRLPHCTENRQQQRLDGIGGFAVGVRGAATATRASSARTGSSRPGLRGRVHGTAPTRST